MSREWKPGEAAVLRCDDGDCPDSEHPGIKGRLTEWYILDRGEYMHDAEPVRPLVTIDPENLPEVERLAYLFLAEHRKNGGAYIGAACDAMQAALREYANPKPPRPEEPRGKWAVVVDAGGRCLIRAAWATPEPWNALGTGDFLAWDDINVESVLSDGVQP